MVLATAVPDSNGVGLVLASPRHGRKADGIPPARQPGPAFSQGTWIDAAGRPTPFGDGVLQILPLEYATVAGGVSFPMDWRIDLPEKGVHVTVSALNPGTYMATSFPYWEGPVTVRGTHEGVGYLEMTAE